MQHANFGGKRDLCKKRMEDFLAREVELSRKGLGSLIVRDWVQAASFSIRTGTSKFQNAGRVGSFSTRDKVL